MTGAKISINSIYTALRREVENDPIQEIPRNYYQSASTVLGTITREKYDGVEGVLNTRDLFVTIRINYVQQFWDMQHQLDRFSSIITFLIKYF